MAGGWVGALLGASFSFLGGVRGLGPECETSPSCSVLAGCLSASPLGLPLCHDVEAEGSFPEAQPGTFRRSRQKARDF